MNQGEVATKLTFVEDKILDFVSIPYESGRSGHRRPGVSLHSGQRINPL